VDKAQIAAENQEGQRQENILTHTTWDFIGKGEQEAKSDDSADSDHQWSEKRGTGIKDVDVDVEVDIFVVKSQDHEVVEDDEEEEEGKGDDDDEDKDEEDEKDEGDGNEMDEVENDMELPVDVMEVVRPDPDDALPANGDWSDYVRLWMPAHNQRMFLIHRKLNEW
jgi:hypothetical protein